MSRHFTLIVLKPSVNWQIYMHINKYFFITNRLLAALISTTLLAGCHLSNTRIDANDVRLVVPAFRAGMNFNDGTQPASEYQSGNAIDVGVAKAKGSDTQSLASSQSPITFNNTTFLAPVQVRNDFDLEFSDISWRKRKFFDDRAFGIEVSAGVGFSSLDLAVTSPTQIAAKHLNSWGPQAGFGLIWRLDQNSTIQTRIGGFLSTHDEGVNEMLRLEVSYTQAFFDNLNLRIGYAAWNVYGQTSPYDSDFKMNFFGPVVALNWDFNAVNKKILVKKIE